MYENYLRRTRPRLRLLLLLRDLRGLRLLVLQKIAYKKRIGTLIIICTYIIISTKVCPNKTNLDRRLVLVLDPDRRRGLRVLDLDLLVGGPTRLPVWRPRGGLALRRFSLELPNNSIKSEIKYFSKKNIHWFIYGHYHCYPILELLDFEPVLSWPLRFPFVLLRLSWLVA